MLRRPNRLAARSASIVRIFVLLGMTTVPGVARANELQVSTGALQRDGGGATLRVPVRVSWKNSWRNARNHDAVWLFVKLRVPPNVGYRHVRIAGTSNEGGSSPFTCQSSADRVGIFCRPAASTHRGDITGSIIVEIDTASVPPSVRAAQGLEARAFGLEMVYIPDGPFSVGDRDTTSVSRAAFYRSTASGGHGGLFRITSEAPIRVAPEEGALYYRAQSARYEGDRSGPVPAEFPKGTRAFYIMKYEILQGQYAEFLNTIAPYGASFRAPLGGRDYAAERGTIRIENGAYVAAKPNRPANELSWDDGTAFADWAGLRPMTELEFSKAARGPVEPVALDYPWGTSSKALLARRLGPDGDLVETGQADEARLSDETREALGASYWWVMDLAGSVWERAVTIGHPKGRAFQGTHGDGMLRDYGLATNADWPLGDHEAGGYGYRGGGHYERARELARDPMARDLTPHSPTEWRSYGSWGGAPRGVAYGFRAVRTADPAR